MQKPVLGILGGVGPLATAYFMELIIQKTPVECDQDNIPMIVFNDPQIPDRTAFILDRDKPDPLPEMKNVAVWLEQAGADYIAIPCNTAHYFYEQIADATSIPVLNIMKETTERIVDAYGTGVTIGLLATDGTLSSGVFQEYLSNAGLDLALPTEDEQREIVMPLIYDRIKRNLPYDPADFLHLANRMHRDGCDAIIVGCTELSVAYQNLENPPGYLVDAMDVLAERCVGYHFENRASEGR